MASFFILSGNNLLKVRTGHRLVVEEALYHIAAEVFKEVYLRLRFNALGHRFEIKALRQRYPGCDDILVLVGEVVSQEEASVDFQRIERHHGDKVQR